MYSRDEVRTLTDKVLGMAKADAAEVEFSGGERSATRFANSNITANIVQFDQSLTLTVYNGAKSGSSTTREFDDDSPCHVPGGGFCYPDPIDSERVE